MRCGVKEIYFASYLEEFHNLDRQSALYFKSGAPCSVVDARWILP